MSKSSATEGREQESPQLSIIIPARSIQEATPTVVAIAACANFEACEVVLVLDGNVVPETSALHRVFAEARVHIIAVPRSGRIGHLRNIGSSKAKAHYLFFLDSDCRPQVDTITQALAARSRGLVVRGHISFIADNYCSRLDARIREVRYASNPTFAYCPNLLIQAKAFAELGAFAGEFRYGSDGEFAERLKRAGVAVINEPKILVTHDCTDSVAGIFGKWIKYGEGRFLRYQRHPTSGGISKHFPNLFRPHKGVQYNLAVLLCNITRALGLSKALLRSWQQQRRHLDAQKDQSRE